MAQLMLQSPQGAQIVAAEALQIKLGLELQSPQGAQIVAGMCFEDAIDSMLQSPQGAQIVATIMPEYSAKGIYFPVIFTRFSISYFIL